jgi:hypothetical protein
MPVQIGIISARKHRRQHRPTAALAGHHISISFSRHPATFSRHPAELGPTVTAGSTDAVTARRSSTPSPANVQKSPA